MRISRRHVLGVVLAIAVFLSASFLLSDHSLTIPVVRPRPDPAETPAAAANEEASSESSAPAPASPSASPATHDTDRSPPAHVPAAHSLGESPQQPAQTSVKLPSWRESAAALLSDYDSEADVVAADTWRLPSVPLDDGGKAAPNRTGPTYALCHDRGVYKRSPDAAVPDAVLDGACLGPKGAAAALAAHYAYFPPGDPAPPLVELRTRLLERQMCWWGGRMCEEATLHNQPHRGHVFRQVPGRILHMMSGFLEAAQRGVAFIPGEVERAHGEETEILRWEYTERHCQARGLSCFMRRATRCSTHPIKAGPRKLSYEMRGIDSDRLDLLALDTQALNEGRRSAQVGTFATTAEMLLFLMQPNGALQLEIARAKAALGWDTLPRPVLAMHMWKPNEEPDLSEKSAEHYVQAALLAQARGGFKSLFIVTDSKRALAAARRLQAKKHFVVASLDHPGYEQHMLCDQAVHTFLNLFLAAQADGFLGHFGDSVFTRLVARLSYAIHTPQEREALLLWSVDSTWPASWGDVVRRGRLVMREVTSAEGEIQVHVRIDAINLSAMNASYPLEEARVGFRKAEPKSEPPPSQKPAAAESPLRGVSDDRWKDTPSRTQRNPRHKEEKPTHDMDGVVYPNFKFYHKAGPERKAKQFRGDGIQPKYTICLSLRNVNRSKARWEVRCRDGAYSDGFESIMREHYQYFPPGDHAPALQAFRRQLFQRQFCSHAGAPCEQATVFAHSRFDNAWSGLGARILHSLVAFTDALARNVSFVIADSNEPVAYGNSVEERVQQRRFPNGLYSWLYTDEESCPSRGNACYFRETTSCDYNPVDKPPRKKMFLQRSIDKDTSQRIGVGNFAFTAEMLLFMLQPNKLMRREIERAKKALHWESLPRPILAMHVRHGKLTSETPYVPFEDFMDAAMMAQEMHGFKTLFVFTDSKEVLERLPAYRDRFTIAAWDYPQWTQHNYDATKDSYMRLRHRSAKGCYEALPILIDLYLAADTQGFLGLFTSNVDRVVARLQWAKSSPAEREKLIMWSLDGWPTLGLDMVTVERLASRRVFPTENMAHIKLPKGVQEVLLGKTGHDYVEPNTPKLQTWVKSSPPPALPHPTVEAPAFPAPDVPGPAPAAAPNADARAEESQESPAVNDYHERDSNSTHEVTASFPFEADIPEEAEALGQAASRDHETGAQHAHPPSNATQEEAVGSDDQGQATGGGGGGQQSGPTMHQRASEEGAGGGGPQSNAPESPVDERAAQHVAQHTPSDATRDDAVDDDDRTRREADATGGAGDGGPESGTGVGTPEDASSESASEEGGANSALERRRSGERAPPRKKQKQPPRLPSPRRETPAASATSPGV